jgi:hypothetical protein
LPWAIAIKKSEPLFSGQAAEITSRLVKPSDAMAETAAAAQAA